MTGVLQAWVVAKQQKLAPAGSLRERLTLGAFWSLCGAVISRGFLLAASIVCARFLGKQGFGALGMIQSTAGMFGLVGGLELGLTATKYVSEFRRQDPLRTGRILALSATAAFISGSIITVLVILLAPYLAQHVLAAPQLAAPLAIGSGLIFFGAINGAQTGALAGFEAFQTIARVNICAGVASFPLIVFGVWRGGLKGAMCGWIAALAIQWALNNRALRRECGKANISYQFAGWRRELDMLHRFSVPASLASLLVVGGVWVCNALLARQPEGYAELGLYAAADKWRVLIVFVPTYAFAMIVPVLSNLRGEGNETGFRKVFRTNLRLSGGLALLAAVVIAALAAPIMEVYGKSFRGGQAVLMVLAFSAVAEVLNAILGQPLIAAHQMWWRFAFNLFLVVVLVGFAWLLIPKWEALGLAISYAVAYAAMALGLFLFHRQSSWSSLVPKTVSASRLRKSRENR
jgi:O-antigen/teichoic acid export membrane protein